MKHPAEIDLDAIKAKGYLTAILDNSTTSYFVYKGQPMGFEYELLHKFADHLGVKLKIKLTTDIWNAFELLNKGEGDIVAFNLTITKERKSWVDFSHTLYTTQQVLVQRKPANWRSMKLHEIEKQVLRNPISLIGKTVYVRKNSSYVDRLNNLSEEIGGDIIIKQDSADVETEELIKKVATGQIKYTVSDDDIAKLNATYYPILDVNTPISFPQRIAWAVRKTSPEFLKALDAWIYTEKRKPDFYVIYNRYFNSPKSSLNRMKSDYSSIAGNKLSPFDSLIRKGASVLDWDWRLLASQIYQESRFDPSVKSWAGAVGLLQILPETAKLYGAKDPYNPKQNIMAGAKYLHWLEEKWQNSVSDSTTRIKFVLASYNVGLGHVEDARDLAKKYGADTEKWDGNVEKYLLLKSKRKYYTDPVVRYGYCRGEEPVEYVKEVIYRYNQYKTLVPLHLDDSTAENKKLSLAK